MNLDAIFSLLDTIIANPNREDAFLQLTDEYINQNELFRSTVRELWDFGTHWKIPNWKRLASTIGETSTPKQRIQARLVYLSLNKDFCYDTRDIILHLAVIYHSILEADFDPNILFNEIAVVSCPIVRDEILKFLERPEYHKSKQAFLVEKSIDKNGIIEIYVKGF
ncbi:MAG: hypothetical protein LBK06_08455 [Planctomycetaceae bacterium]|jgi:hypothetical protein|nr:hypothetical protein [Planctomycetaceae bacterium]